MFNNLEKDSVFTPEQVLENRGRVAIFIDGSNLFYAALQLGMEIDYTKLLCRLTAGSRLLRSFFYTGVDRTNEKQQGFLLWMRRNGYRVIAKDLVQLPDGSQKTLDFKYDPAEKHYTAKLPGAAAGEYKVAILSDIGGEKVNGRFSFSR